MDQKTLILSLIEDDLRSFRLIDSLTAIGLDASDHHLSLGNTIFTLMNIHVTVADTTYDSYVALAGLARYVPLKDPDNEMERMTMDVYNFLDALPKAIHSDN